MKLLTLFFFLLFPAYPHTEADVHTLGDIAWLENGHTGKTEEENREVLMLTMVVVLNRMTSGEWGGDTIEKVLNAKGQYASYTRNNIGKTDTPDWVYDMARDLLMFGSNVPDYIVYQSMQPKLGTVWKVIDGEYFATKGGHKYEGNDFIAEVNGSISDYSRDFLNLFRNTITIGASGANMGNSWWNCLDSCCRGLDVAYGF